MNSPAEAAVDTSVAVPTVLVGHVAHGSVLSTVNGRSLALAGHAALEAYSVLTRLPVDDRVAPVDAESLLATNFSIVEPVDSLAQVRATIAAAGIVGGAVYDALVGLAAHQNGLVLLTRDLRALGTYAALGVAVEVIA